MALGSVFGLRFQDWGSVLEFRIRIKGKDSGLGFRVRIQD
jgi:hypothetical protein